MTDNFRDWIPDGEDTGSITENGFADYVPDPEPKPQQVPPVEPIQPIQPVEPVQTVVNQEPVVPPLEQGGQE